MAPEFFGKHCSETESVIRNIPRSTMGRVLPIDEAYMFDPGYSMEGLCLTRSYPRCKNIQARIDVLYSWATRTSWRRCSRTAIQDYHESSWPTSRFTSTITPRKSSAKSWTLTSRAKIYNGPKAQATLRWPSGPSEKCKIFQQWTRGQKPRIQSHSALLCKA